MGTGYFRHAQMNTVTPGRKLPPQHGQTRVSLPQSQHLGKKKEERNPVNKVTRSHDWETVVQQDDLNQAPDQQHLAGLVLWWHPSGVTPG